MVTSDAALRGWYGMVLGLVATIGFASYALWSKSRQADERPASPPPLLDAPERTPQTLQVGDVVQHLGTDYLVEGALAFSDDGRAARLPFIALFAVSSWLLYRLTRVLFGAPAGVVAVLALNCSAFFSFAGGWVLPDGPLMLAMLAASLVLARHFFADQKNAGANHAQDEKPPHVPNRVLGQEDEIALRIPENIPRGILVVLTDPGADADIKRVHDTQHQPIT